MGNCGRKIKRDVNTWVHKSRNGTSRISTPMHCPKCNMFFSSTTTYNIVNHHLDTCLSVQDSIMLNQSTTSTTANQPRISSRISNTLTAKNNDPFVWVKKPIGDNKYIWEKQKSLSSIPDKDLGTLSREEIAVLEFEDKRKWFRNGLELFRIHWTQGADYLRVERTELLDSSVKAIRKCNLFKEMKVEFKGDEKVNDAGGLLREWISLIIKELVRPDIGLFVQTDSEEVSYSINPKSSELEQNLDMYEFAGKIIGKAIFERITVDIHFDDCLLKAIAGRSLALEDLKSLDTPLYKSLVYLQENTLGENDILQEYFVVPGYCEQPIELCEGGAEKLVNDNNKHEYIQLLVEWYGKKRIEKKINAFVNGMASCIPIETLLVFDPSDLEMMINGVPFVDADDWENNTIYKGNYTRTSQVINWFWKVIHELSQEELAKFLQFCTGSSRTPVEGFRSLESNRGIIAKFCIESAEYNKNKSMITAHTCFNRLVLPQYPNEEALRDHISTILQTDFKGVFGLD